MDTLMIDAQSDPFDKPEFDPDEANETVKPDFIRVVVADSHAVYRAGVNKILTPETDMQVVSEVDSVTSLHSAIESAPADIVLLEGQLVSMAANDIPQLVRHAPDTKIIIATAGADQSDTVEFYRRGARGVIPRSISAAQLVKSVRKVAAGETWIDNETVNVLIDRYQSQTASLNSPPDRPQLSAKELTIMTGITHGMKNKQIASQLGTTEQVIRNSLSKVYKKLGVSDRLELAIYCQNHGFQEGSV